MNNHFSSEYQRRVEQFQSELAPMHHRTVNVVKDCCFTILDEHSKDTDNGKALQESRPAERVKSTSIAGDSFADRLSAVGGDMGWQVDGWNDEGWRQDDDSHRFVQFIFLEHHFEMDLPRPMLSVQEAESLLRTRSGFYFLGDRGDAAIHAHTIRQFHPLRKAYVHGDHFAAAEDAAHIFFKLWHFPIDSTLYLASFGGKYSWESDKPIR